MAELPIKFEPITEKLTKLYEDLPADQRDQVTAVLVPYFESVKTMCELLPKIIQGPTAAEKALIKITAVEDDEDVESVSGTLGKVKESYEVNSARRKQITQPADDLKAYLMQFEKKVSTDAKEKNEYNRVRMLIQNYQQEKLEKVRKQQAAAEAERKRKDAIVDIGLKVSSKFTNLLVTLVKKADDGSKDFLIDKTTVENFDAQAATFSGWKPKLKEDDYNNCFKVDYDVFSMTAEDFKAAIAEIKKVETYEKWNAKVIEETTPFIEAWKKKIPQIKADKIAIANAASEEAKKKLQAQQDAQAEKDRLAREKELKDKQDSIEKEASDKAELSKMENNFQEQAVMQTLEDPGSVKKVLRFIDDKSAPKALSEIIYHMFLNKRGKFKGIYKLKDGQRVKDKFGRDEYVDWVDFLMRFHVANVDDIPTGCTIEEESKVAIKKQTS